MGTVGATGAMGAVGVVGAAGGTARQVAPIAWPHRCFCNIGVNISSLFTNCLEYDSSEPHLNYVE